MHICHIITRLIVGGAQENTILTCRGLVERGHRVTLIGGAETGPEGSLWPDAQATGCELVKVAAMRRSVRPLADWSAVRELTRLLARLRPDVVHTHSSKAGILGRMAAARAAVPVIVHTIHGMSYNRTQPAAVRLLYRALERRAALHTTAFVSVADAMTDQAVAAGMAPRDRFVTIRSGMKTADFAPNSQLRAHHRKRWGVGDDEIVVGTVARLFKHKGYEDILAAMPDAVAREPRVKFVWIGGGSHRASYERQLETIGLRDRVHMTGLISPKEIAGHLSGLDILLHASRWEGLSRAVVQALLTEVPVVSFDNDGAPEVVIPKETGVLVRLGDIEGLTNGVLALATDPAARLKFGQCGRRRCLDAFDWRAMVTSLDALYRRLVELNLG